MKPNIVFVLAAGLLIVTQSHAHDAQMDQSSNGTQPAMKHDAEAKKQPFDLQFLDTMSHHHQGALEMAKRALSKGSSAEIKAFANEIIGKQQAEIEQFKAWRAAWYPAKPSAVNMHMPGMVHTMKHMQKDMGPFMSAQGAVFDRLFLEMMIPHHQGAIDMSQAAQKQLQHPELREAAQKIIDDQNKEIVRMREWLKQLPKS